MVFAFLSQFIANTAPITTGASGNLGRLGGASARDDDDTAASHPRQAMRLATPRRLRLLAVLHLISIVSSIDQPAPRPRAARRPKLGGLRGGGDGGDCGGGRGIASASLRHPAVPELPAATQMQLTAAIPNVDDPAAAAAARRHAAPFHRLLIAYLLWAFFGIFGAHHLYLGRNVAALQCLLTFNLLGFGMPLDLLSMRRYVRELTAAEAADAAALAQRGRYVPSAAVTSVGPPTAAATAAQQQAAKARRVGLFGFVWLLLRFAIRSIPQFVFGRWLGTMCARTLPDGVAGGLGMAGARGAWLHAAGAAVAVWLSVATAGRRQLSTAAQIASFAAMGPLGLVRCRRRCQRLVTIHPQTHAPLPSAAARHVHLRRQLRTNPPQSAAHALSSRIVLSPRPVHTDRRRWCCRATRSSAPARPRSSWRWSPPTALRCSTRRDGGGARLSRRAPFSFPPGASPAAQPNPDS